MYNQRDLSDRELIARIPHVMGTQHPDNVSVVPFGDSARVNRELEEAEVLYNITELGVRELMIDYEKKQGGCTPLWDWLHRCRTCLEERVIGRDFHVTPRLPNGDTDRGDPYFWQSMGIFVNSLLAMQRMGVPGLAFSEFIIPDVARGATVAKIERDIVQLYELQSEQYRHYGDGSPFPFDGDFFIQGIPLIETVENLLNPRPIWDELIAARKEYSGRDTFVQRSFIARSDPALKAGMVPALLAATVALAQGRAYERETGVRVPQIIGIGSAPFRGGLEPEAASVRAVLDTYPGMATVTVQSAFRYDHPPEQVVAAGLLLEEAIAADWARRGQLDRDLRASDLERVAQVVFALKQTYEETFREVMPLVTRVADRVPSHRERYQDVQLAGEARRVGGMPAVRAIKFAAACYSLGLPPGAFGFRGWVRLGDEDRVLAETVCPTLKHWMARELRWFNPAVRDLLHALPEARNILEDLDIVLAWLGTVESDPAHRDATSRVHDELARSVDCTEAIMAAAAVRRFLG